MVQYHTMQCVKLKKYKSRRQSVTHLGSVSIQLSNALVPVLQVLALKLEPRLAALSAPSLQIRQIAAV